MAVATVSQPSSRAVNPALSRGAYILSEAEGGAPEVILIGTGSEVSLCVAAQKNLAASRVKARVVSMPSWNLFEAQSADYRESVLPGAVRKRVTVEAASTLGWHKWAADGALIGLDRYGVSAPGDEIMKHLGFTPENVAETAAKLLKG